MKQRHQQSLSMSLLAQTLPLSAKLQEHCQYFELGDPVYKVFSTQSGGGYYCTVTIAGEPHTGAIRLDEEDAKESAAVEFAVRLISLSECLMNATLSQHDQINFTKLVLLFLFSIRNIGKSYYNCNLSFKCVQQC